MGYRSDILMRFVSEGEELEEEWVKLLLTDPPWLTLALETCNDGEFTRTAKEFRFYASDWKWYDSYDDVQAMEALHTELRKMCERNNRIHGVFIRVGEDDDDIERTVYNNGWDLGYTETVIRED